VHLDYGVEPDTATAKLVTQARADAVIEELKYIGALQNNVVANGYGYGFQFNYSPLVLIRNTGRLSNSRVEYILRDHVPEDNAIEYAALHPDAFDNEDIAMDCPDKGDVLNNKVYYNVNDNYLSEASMKAIDEVAEMLRLCPEVEIEVAGHSDKQSTELFAKALAKNRAQRVYQQLVAMGIDSKRMEVVSYGSSKPVAPNDSPENRQKNRRIEFIVTEAGEEEIEEKEEPKVVVNEQGEKSYNVDGKLYRVGEDLDYKVYFEFDSYMLDSDAKMTIKRVIDYLEDNPPITLSLELHGYTDSIGSEEYNQRLAYNRAKSVRDYMVKFDIDTAQVVLRSYGEADPISTNNTQEGRADNRRVEFKVQELRRSRASKDDDE
jgi:outer membrane protein OmpA-like peptidoglycan-associated protein